MFTESKVTEIFFMADEFCKVFNRMMSKYTIVPLPVPALLPYPCSMQFCGRACFASDASVLLHSIFFFCRIFRFPYIQKAYILPGVKSRLGGKSE